MNSDLTGSQDRSHEDSGPSQLFLLRVWLGVEASEDDWHGRVQHPVTGETHHFRTCAELRHIILGMMAPQEIRPAS